MIFPVYPRFCSKVSGELFFLSFLYLCRRKKVLIGLLLKIVLTLSSFVSGFSYQCTSSISVMFVTVERNSHFITFMGKLLSCFIPVNLSSSAAAATTPLIVRQAAES